MKKVKIVSFIITIILAIFIIVGVFIQVLSSNPPLDSVFEAIAFIISGVSVAIALFEQISSYQERREMTKVMRELKELDNEIAAERALDRTLRKKLDELIATDQRIYRQVRSQARKSPKK